MTIFVTPVMYSVLNSRHDRVKVKKSEPEPSAPVEPQPDRQGVEPEVSGSPLVNNQANA